MRRPVPYMTISPVRKPIVGSPRVRDISPRMLTAARARLSGGADLALAAGEGLPYRDGSFDRVYCSEVLEHVPPERSLAMLESLHDALRPGGVLILTTPQRYSTVELGARLLRFKPMLAIAEP